MSRALPAGLRVMSTSTATITGISTVAIAVSDQDAAKRLFEQLGFATRFDADVDVDFRWIDMAPPGGGASLSIVAASDALPTGIDTGIRFTTPDARAARAHLVDLGLEVGDLL